jgi:hypothetical protein
MRWRGWWSGDEGGLTDSILRGEEMEGVLGDLGGSCTPYGALCRFIESGGCAEVDALDAFLFSAPALPSGIRSGVASGSWKKGVADPSLMAFRSCPPIELCRCRRACWNPADAPFWTGKAVGWALASLNGLAVGSAAAA